MKPLGYQKIEKLENENVSLEFQVQSLIKERENNKMEYQKLFDSIKKTRTRTQREISELIENVNQKTYAYADVRSQNQHLLITISELKSKLKDAEKLYVHSKVRRALFTTPKTAKSKSLDITPVVAKTRFAVVAPLSAHNKDSSASRSTSLFAQENTLSKYMRPKVKTSRKWQKWLEIQLNFVVQIILWFVDSGCSKHMTGNLKLLKNFIEKFIGTIRFENYHFAAITGYGDDVHGNITICHVYYVKGIRHNLILVGQFYDDNLEVAFRSNTCYVHNLEEDDLLTGDHESYLYTISIFYMAASFRVCLMSKSTSTKSWLWHRRLLHLNFGTINHLTKQDLVDGLLKFKYDKDHLCSTPETNRFNNEDLSAESNQTLPKEDFNNLFCPMYEEYFEKRSPEVSINSVAPTTTLHDNVTPSPSSVTIEETKALPLIYSSKEQISLVLTDVADESFQEDSIDLDGNNLMTPLLNFKIYTKNSKPLTTRKSQRSAGGGLSGPRYIWGRPAYQGAATRLTLLFLSFSGEGFLEKFRGGFKQDIDNEGEKNREDEDGNGGVS
ncbi:integrase, catalytic region, zinc finger, CCHC-type containing protein [Tanacetum coccineum]